MSVLTHPSAATVYVADDNAVVRNALGRLLALEPQLHVRSSAGSRDGAAIVVDSALLDDLKHLSIGDFIEIIKSLPSAETATHRRQLRPIPSANDIRDVLSDREMQVVRLIAEGLSNKVISARLALSDKTVKNHISHILAKLNLSARTQVAVHAVRTGIV